MGGWGRPGSDRPTGLHAHEADTVVDDLADLLGRRPGGTAGGTGKGQS